MGSARGGALMASVADALSAFERGARGWDRGASCAGRSIFPRVCATSMQLPPVDSTLLEYVIGRL